MNQELPYGCTRRLGQRRGNQQDHDLKRKQKNNKTSRNSRWRVTSMSLVSCSLQRNRITIIHGRGGNKRLQEEDFTGARSRGSPCRVYRATESGIRTVPLLHPSDPPVATTHHRGQYSRALFSLSHLYVHAHTHTHIYIFILLFIFDLHIYSSYCPSYIMSL